MASGPTEYKFTDLSGNIKDFYDVFQPGNALITTGFKISNGTDLGNLFLSGNSGILTNYKNSLGQDLGSLFAPTRPFIVNNADRSGYTASYYYTIFSLTGLTGSVTFNPKYNYTSNSKLYFVCVGAGGGGGGSRGGLSCGGGGGGGVYSNFVLFNSSSPTYSITIGFGGAGGAPNSTGGNGGESRVTYSGTNFVIKCTGGSGGTNTGAGSGGVVYIDNINTSLGTVGSGGNGGDAGSSTLNNGSPCYYNTGGNSLNIPNEIINADSSYISNYYSGGGGGGKGNIDDRNYSGGEGGGTLFPGVSPTFTNTGLGGAAGVIDGPATNGQPGNGYGSGGGAAGRGGGGTDFSGGNGKQGIVICYALL
jgi:hypothetical protein